ncbi:hypothetical protein Bca52824_029318 [Brassica carinata]|uniref:Uncharacterized protein n=1 Tax=Brassica carinata TaxID=52824 RepID=A0A8X7VEK7_BRACI|nr:hypothetical protein Bca52824_029318 [Brassica carinata]
MEHTFASRENGFGYQEQTDGFSFGSGVWSFISDDMLNSSSTFDSFATWCDSPSATDTLFTQYGLATSQPMPFGATITSSHAAVPRDSTFSCLTRSFNDLGSYSLDSNELSGKRRSVLNCTIPRSLSHSLDEKMLKALSLFMQFSGSGEGTLAQIWTPVKKGDQYMLSTCDQAYLLDPRLSQYREVSRKFTFASEANQCSSPGLPGRVFISGVREWTSNVMYYKKDEYLRMKHAIDNEVRGSIAIPILETTGASCCAVMELVTSDEKLNFDTEMDSICRALKAVNLRTSAVPRPQYLSSNQRDALAEIQDVLRALCHAHRLPLALTWIPNSGEKGVLCVEETACYVNDIDMEGFVHACLQHPLREKEGIVGKAFVSNQPFFSSDVKAYDISDYPLVHHARKHGLNAAVAIKLRSTYTGEDDYILELFLPLSMNGSLEQQLLLDSLEDTLQRVCRTLRTVSDVEATNSTTSMSSDKENCSTGSQGTCEQDMRKARTPEKKKGTIEKNVSLRVLQQHFSGSLKDAARSIGVCPTTLKRICRQHGIMRWPSRKINKVNRSLRKIQTVLDSVHGIEGGLRFDSATREFVSVGSSDGNNANGRGKEDMAEDTSSFELLKPESVDNAIKLEDDIITNGSFMEVNASDQQCALVAEQSGFNGSSQAIGMDTTIRCSGNIIEPNRSMSDSSNGSGAVMLKSNNSSESGSATLTVKATYREDTTRFKFDPSVGCLQLYREVGKRFRLQDGLFQLKYCDDEEEWVMLVTDSDLQECLEILYGMGKHTVKFLVRDLPAPVGSSAGSNGYLGVR